MGIIIGYFVVGFVIAIIESVFEREINRLNKYIDFIHLPPLPPSCTVVAWPVSCVLYLLKGIDNLVTFISNIIRRRNE